MNAREVSACLLLRIVEENYSQHNKIIMKAEAGVSYNGLIQLRRNSLTQTDSKDQKSASEIDQDFDHAFAIVKETIIRMAREIANHDYRKRRENSGRSK